MSKRGGSRCPASNSYTLLWHTPRRFYKAKSGKEGGNTDGSGEENGRLPGHRRSRREAGLSVLLRHFRCAVLRDQVHSGGYGDEALEIAWETEGRWAFDRCPQCGRYVSSAMFNINAERCLDCAPWENEYPVFCHHCGIRLKDPDAFFCPACGARLLVGGTEEEEGRTE